MNPTELILQETNGFLKAVGDPELVIPNIGVDRSEIELLTDVRQE